MIRRDRELLKGVGYYDMKINGNIANLSHIIFACRLSYNGRFVI